MVRFRFLRGFTLIELMIAISIIAVLAAIMIPNFIRAKGNGNLSSCESNLKSIATALEMYGVDNSSNYPLTAAGTTLLTPNYLKVIPTCPAAGTDTYSATYVSTVLPTNSYSFFCLGTNHSVISILPNFPQWNSSQGLNNGR